MLDVNLIRTPTSRSVRFMTGAALFVLTVGIAAAQTGPSTLSGTVTDSSGAPVPGAAVTLASTQSKAKYEVTTDQNGRYEFVPLPADSYSLEAKMPGFKRVEDPISLSGKSMKRDLTLALGELTETVTIVSDGTAGASDAAAKISPVREASPAARAGFQKDLQECQASSSGGRVRPPRKIRDVRPVYPADLSASGLGGTVVLRATVGTDGLVRDINVVKSVHPGLDSAAVEAVRQWQFDGTLLNCTPVEVVFNTTLNFSTK